MVKASSLLNARQTSSPKMLKFSRFASPIRIRNSFNKFIDGKLTKFFPASLKLSESILGNSFRLQSGCNIPFKILIGTHHKTGTAWLESIFKKACIYHHLNYHRGQQENLPAQFDVFLQDHSLFDIEAFGDSFRGLHLIRDPRDVVISGCFYHQRSHEKWLHQRRTDIKGMTYFEKINSFDRLDDQILFEMENSSRKTIIEMSNWNYKNPLFCEIKYEDLIVDNNLMLFHKVFDFLGFSGAVMPSLLAIAYNNSLFSGKHKNTSHIRSGKVRQWETYFKEIHKDRFLNLFDDTLIKLGYEKDNAWAE